MAYSNLDLLLAAICAGMGMFFLRAAGQRSAADVLADLDHGAKEIEACSNGRKGITSGSGLRPILAGALAGAVISLKVNSVSSVFALLVVGAAFGVIVSEGRRRSASERGRQSLHYYLPIVMERIVMAVESGLDIIPAIEVIVALERAESTLLDPVTTLFAEISRYSESGMRFSEALSLVESKVDSPAFKHALVHLGLAYQEGGEIIHPLRELSDSTQLYFQESIEEEIAKMPVKATLPLLCTFGGLIISFLTAPLVQVMMITSQAAPR